MINNIAKVLKCGCTRIEHSIELCDRHKFMERGDFSSFQKEHYIYVLDQLEQVGLEWSATEKAEAK